MSINNFSEYLDIVFTVSYHSKYVIIAPEPWKIHVDIFRACQNILDTRLNYS